MDEYSRVQHILEPEYRYNSFSGEDVLCFTYFGWEMFDQVRSEGFTNICAFLFRSEVVGYMGEEQILFIADKSPR